MSEDLKKYKLYFLQLKYMRIMKIINNLEIHFTHIKQLNLINSEQIIDYSNKIYTIIKNINTLYNQHINHYFDNFDTDIDNLITQLSNKPSNEIIKIIKLYELDIPTNLFSDINNVIIDIIKIYGYIDINEILKIVYPSININCNIIEELNNISIPLGVDIFTVANETRDYYWRIPNKYENDLLEMKRELWIKAPDISNLSKYIRINIVFKIDCFSSRQKTSQIICPYLHKMKTNVISQVEQMNIDINFVKTFIRHDYIGNIYCMDIEQYIKYIAKIYSQYTKLNESTFVNIMKDFASNDNIKHMFDIIQLLLYGSDDMNEIACLLLGLLKEKNNKNQYNIIVYDLIYNNLTFYLQSKIKKSSNTIKQSINKIKKISLDDVDYKTQLIINKHIPPNIKALVLDKIEEMKASNNEYYKQLLYVKTILNYPWNSSGDDIIYDTLRSNKKLSMDYLNKVEDKLKRACYGHDEAKKLLLQMIAKWISNPASHGTCFGLVGPPGVGKTLLAKSVGKALDIPFAQITLGGQNDGEILHGHGYTYSGSQPGLIVKKMVEMGKSRCILYFDELDKTCAKHGSLNEITSILIHLTDPNMNKSFQDRFFQGVDFPLDKVIMIFSYNDSKLVDPILLDRLKEIKVLPYTIEDKINICQTHLINEISSSVGLDSISFDNSIIEYIIENYTNEAGVREIKRKIEEIYMNLNIDNIYKRNLFKKNIKKIILKKDNIISILKEPDISRRYIHSENMVGVINGMYATSSGDGGITPIQIYPNTNTGNKYEIKLTGKQGDIMKESVSCSLTTAIEWLKSKKYNVDELNGFHVHTPDGATPKDGPSAGCAFTCAFISRILNRPIKNTIAMTGEVELTGQVSKIGGLDFKLMGAKKAGIKIAYVPLENKKDIEEIKEKYKQLIDNDFQVKLFSSIDEIIEEILQI